MNNQLAQVKQDTGVCIKDPLNDSSKLQCVGLLHGVSIS